MTRSYKIFHLRCSIKTVFLKHFEILKHLKACNSIKKRLQLKCFPMNIAKFLIIPILKNIFKRLLPFIQRLEYCRSVLRSVVTRFTFVSSLAF